MKCVCMQYIFALLRLHQQEVMPFERTVHLIFVPDEEVKFSKK
jgi:acetylornithine deacetylase/succinyl-diaminopimelate desuccinylase-like protein